jgi:hypothetical protein
MFRNHAEKLSGALQHPSRLGKHYGEGNSGLWACTRRASLLNK